MSKLLSNVFNDLFTIDTILFTALLKSVVPYEYPASTIECLGCRKNGRKIL